MTLGSNKKAYQKKSMKSSHCYYPQRVRRHTISRLSMIKESMLVAPVSNDLSDSELFGSETTLTFTATD